MYSIQTNVNSLMAQDNLRINQNFQTATIQQLTSGYRINSSGDDAAGLSIANQFRSDSTELTQGVRNANDGVSQLQIVDGGLSNISTMLDRMKTLATQSASSTFTGNRGTLQTEYSQLLSEITRQAADIGLNSGGSMNKSLSVYIGGARTSTQAGSGSVNVNLSAAASAVDSTSLSLNGTNVNGGTVGVDFSTTVGVRVDNPASTYLAAATDSQALTVNYSDGSGNLKTATINLLGNANGLTGTQMLANINAGLVGTGITASVDSGTTSPGLLQFSGANAFTVYAAAPTGGTGVTNAAGTLVNNALNSQTIVNPALISAGTEQFSITDGTRTTSISLTTTALASATNSGNTIQAEVNSINTQLAAAQTNAGGAPSVIALLSNNGTSISFQSASNFSITESATATTGGIFTALGAQSTLAAGAGAYTAASTSATAGSSALTALSAINSAVQALGVVQGIVGAGENKLNYAINLAQSQITNFDAAESQIRDADVAQEAANLTKAQVLQQASIAAMSQANSAPEAVLSLLSK